MKLLLPVGAIIFGSGFCCCSGEFFEGFKKGAEEAVERAQSGQAVEAPIAPVEPAGPGMAAPAAPGGTSKLEGACGSFAGLGVTAPTGAKMTLCTADPSGDTLIFTSPVDTAATCAGLKDWAVAAGFTVKSDGNFAGTSSIVAERGSEELVIGCTNVLGNNSVTMALRHP